MAPREKTTLVCSLSSPSGEQIGALTIDLQPNADTAPPHERMGLLRAGAAILARALRENRVPLALAEGMEDGPTPAGNQPELAVRAVLMRGGEAFDEHYFRFPLEQLTPRQAPGSSLAELVERYERGLIEDALRTTRGNRARAARLLKTTERILGYRIQQYGIDTTQFRR